MTSKIGRYALWISAAILTLSIGYLLIWAAVWAVSPPIPVVFPAVLAAFILMLNVAWWLYAAGLFLVNKRGGLKQAMRSSDGRWSLPSRLMTAGAILFALLWEVWQVGLLVLRGEGMMLSDVPILVFDLTALFGCGLMVAAFALVARQGGWEQAMQSRPDGRWSLARRLIVAAALFGSVFLVGVMWSGFASGCVPEKLTPEEQKALAIAKAAIEERGGMDRNTEFDKPFGNPVSGRWSVTVWHNPKAAGGFVTVEIDRNGKVTAIRPGK